MEKTMQEFEDPFCQWNSTDESYHVDSLKQLILESKQATSMSHEIIHDCDLNSC